MTALVFSTGAYEYMRDALCQRPSFSSGDVERRSFPDGEHYLRLAVDCRDRDTVCIGGTISDADILELYDLASGLVAAGAGRLTIVIPYFGYSTMERAVRPGEVVTAKNRARLLSSIPTASRGNRVVLVDLHVAGIEHYFEGGLRPVHVYAKPLIASAARRLGGDDFVLASTDAGRAKWVESLANDLGVTVAFAYKRRLAGDRTAVTGVSAHVRDQRVIIYDDMIRSGSSLIGAARAYRDAGAAGIAAIATHGILPADALDRIRDSGLFDRLVCTDTHPRARQLAAATADGFLEVESVVPLLCEQLEEIS